MLIHPESRKESRKAAHIMDPVCAGLSTLQVARRQRDDETVSELRDTYDSGDLSCRSFSEGRRPEPVVPLAGTVYFNRRVTVFIFKHKFHSRYDYF